MREKTARKLRALLALFPPTPWKEPEGKPSLVSGKGAGPLTLGREPGVKPKEQEPPTCGICRQRRVKLKICKGVSLLLFSPTPLKGPGRYSSFREREKSRCKMHAMLC